MRYFKLQTHDRAEVVLVAPEADVEVAAEAGEAVGAGVDDLSEPFAARLKRVQSSLRHSFVELERAQARARVPGLNPEPVVNKAWA